MMYLADTAAILISLGYTPGIDFIATSVDGVVTLNWTNTDPRPTPEDIAQKELLWRNAATWATQAKARKDREAKAALALPDSDDPVILRRKLNAALHLIQR